LAFLIASYSAKIAFASVAVRSMTCSVVLTVVLVVRTVVLTVDVLMVCPFVVSDRRPVGRLCPVSWLL
jgi:hypothetical protein